MAVFVPDVEGKVEAERTSAKGKFKGDTTAAAEEKENRVLAEFSTTRGPEQKIYWKKRGQEPLD